MSTFRTIRSAGDIEVAVRDHIRLWWKEYAAEYERQHGRSPRYYLEPQAYEVTSEFTYWAEDFLPHVLVLSPGLTDEPIRRRSGPGEATWAVGIINTVGGGERRTTRDMMHAYAAIARTLVDQLPDMGAPDFIKGTKWVDDQYRDIPAVDSKTLGSATVFFEVTAEVHDPRGKPPEPTPRPDPYAGPGPDRPVVGEVRTVDIDIVKELP